MSCPSPLQLNPTPKPLASPLCNGSWELQYTTSASILGMSRPPAFRPSGKILQVLDTVNLKARNIEGAPFFNQVSDWGLWRWLRLKLSCTIMEGVRVAIHACRVTGIYRWEHVFSSSPHPFAGQRRSDTPQR